MATPNATPRQESCTEEIQSVEANTVYKKELDFIKQPPLEYFCPVSLELLLEPQQTKCCGNHLSQEAAKKLQEEGKPCPMCKSEEWSADLDKYHRRKVHQVRVRCWYEGSGCGWEGSMHEFERHIDSCVIRPWECEYCGLKCTYGEGVERHWPECHKFPEPCPNGCEVGSVERCGMEQHRSVCPLEPVACEMKEFGCSVVVPRRELATHMRESELQHLTAMTALNLRLTRQLQQDSAERDREIKVLQRQVATLNQSVEEMKTRELTKIQDDILKLKGSVHHVEQHTTGTCFGGIVFEVENCQLKMSNIFYSHHNGYAFQLLVQFYEQKYNDIGVFLKSTTGENDEKLLWPVSVSATLELLNQAGDHHHEVRKNTLIYDIYEILPIDDGLKCYPDEQSDSVQYVMNDCIKFRIHVLIV